MSVCAKLWKSGYVRVVFVEEVGLLLGGRYYVIRCGDRFVCVGGMSVFVVHVSYEPPESGGICVEGDVCESVFSDVGLLCADIIGDFLVECVYVVDDIRCRELSA